MLYLIAANIGLLIGFFTATILFRYGIGIGSRIVYRTKEGLPAFGKEEMPTEQTHTGDYDDEVENEREI